MKSSLPSSAVLHRSEPDEIDNSERGKSCGMIIMLMQLIAYNH